MSLELDTLELGIRGAIGILMENGLDGEYRQGVIGFRVNG